MNELKRNGSGYSDPTAYKAMKNFTGGVNMGVYRGDIFHVKYFVRTSGSETTAERPAVVVSNNTGNKHSDMCEIVYLATKDKKPLPTHAKVMGKTPSMAMCEQVHSVSQDRLVDYIRTCTDEEMKAIDRALMVSLGLTEQPKEQVVATSGMIDELKMQLEGAERMLDEEKAKNRKLNAAINNYRESSETSEKVKLKTERDLYKNLYEQTLEKLIAR